MDIILGTAFYFLPTIISISRKQPKQDTGLIVLVNTFSGWTIIGWIVALIWSFSYNEIVNPSHPQIVQIQQNSNSPSCNCIKETTVFPRQTKQFYVLEQDKYKHDE